MLELKNHDVTQEEIDNFPIAPFGARLVVKEIKVKKVGSIIISSEQQDKDMRSFEGVVVAIGPEVEFVNPGDRVYYGRYSGAYIPRIDAVHKGADEKDYIIMNEIDLLGRIKSEEELEDVKIDE